MLKSYLEVYYYLIIKDIKIELIEVIYDLEYENLQDAMLQIQCDIENGIEGTAYSEGSTVNDFLVENNLLEDYKADTYIYVICKPDEILVELAIDDEE